jgi:hypothetical protein
MHSEIASLPIDILGGGLENRPTNLRPNEIIMLERHPLAGRNNAISVRLVRHMGL